MRILIQARNLPTPMRGGDWTLSARLAAELQRLGNEVVLSPTPVEVESFDVVHGLNIDRSVLAETEAFAQAAVKARVAFTITPLWWPLDRYLASLPAATRLSFRVKGAAPVRALYDRRVSSLKGLRKRQARVLSIAAAILASGSREKTAIEKQFGSLPIEVALFGTTMVPSRKEREREGVLCVARMDPRKNQLALIRALRDTGLKLMLIGSDAIFPTYASECRRESYDAVEFAGFIPETELIEAHYRAKVHVLPSYFELPGLTSLDAAAAGAAVVVSDEGTVRDYLGGDAQYCDLDEDSVRKAVLAAYETGAPAHLSEKVSKRFTWKATAEKYLRTFELARQNRERFF